MATKVCGAVDKPQVVMQHPKASRVERNPKASPFDLIFAVTFALLKQFDRGIIHEYGLSLEDMIAAGI